MFDMIQIERTRNNMIHFSSDEVESFLSDHIYDDNTDEMNDLSLAKKVFMQFTERPSFHNV